MAQQVFSFGGFVNSFGLNYPDPLVSRPTQLLLPPGNEIPGHPNTPAPARLTRVDELPPFVRILSTLLLHTKRNESPQPYKSFITNVTILHDVAFSPKCPILGTGHHFAVFAHPIDPEDRASFKPIDGRAINPEIYCLKTPNFTSNAGTASPAFRTEYYSTTLQELRVLLHPNLRTCENIISLFGLDFQEDYDDYTVAWPVLLMEYAEYGTLDTLQQDISIDTELARILLLDVARGIQALHQCNIIHGDVKSENVLICRHAQRTYIAKLADFGLSLINPNSESDRHRLPGGTFLWSAPEMGSALSVEGLRQTDVYSFGLTVWRVLIGHPSPWSLIPPTAIRMGLRAPETLNEVVTWAKSQGCFDKLVLQTMRNGGSHPFFQQVVEATLCRESSSRHLGMAIEVLSRGQKVASPSSEASDIHWAMEEPTLVLEELDNATGVRLPLLALKPAVLHSLVTGLEALFSGTFPASIQAGWLLFQFASWPQFQLLHKNADECCQILTRLCHLGLPQAQAIVFRYHELHGKSAQSLDINWPKVPTLNGSYYALESFRAQNPEVYRQIIQSTLIIEPDLTDLGQQAELLRCCRQGDYTGCKWLLDTGVSAFPVEEGAVSPLHWIVSFQDENQIQDILELLLANGAVIDAWEGQELDFNFGRVTGTPLHWAIWYRNIPALRALIQVDDGPKVADLNYALVLAASMHFYDVLCVLKTWITSLPDITRVQCDWKTALMCAAENRMTHLARRLRHGDSDLPRAFERTMDIMLAVYTPSEEDLKGLYELSVPLNNDLLLQYLFKRLNLRHHNEILNDNDFDAAILSLGLSVSTIFEILIENGVLSPNSEHGAKKWKLLQVCCFVRQRNPKFVRRLLAMGCAVDGASKDTEAAWTPFAIAVSMGLYNLAIIFLEHGANKDYLLGWLGGLTVTQSLLQNWPDLPISRLKFMLEEIPRLGFGHVTFWGWPGAGGNLLYGLSMNHWSSYTAGYRLGETAKYILSQLADKSCLNKIDSLGSTALRMACANGNLEICRALIEAGQNVNLSLGFSPLRNAKEWMETCRKREREAMKNRKGAGSERRLATILRQRAEEVVQLMVAHGAVDRGFFESIQNTKDYISSGQWQPPSYETAFEMFSGFVDKSTMVNAGSTPLNPTSAGEFRAHHGQRNDVQNFLVNRGRQMDQSHGVIMQIPVVRRYQHHNCLPWRNDSCIGGLTPGGSYVHTVVAPEPRIVQLQSYVPGPFPPANPASRYLSPVPANTSFPDDLYDASFVQSRVPTISERTLSRVAITAEAMCLRIQDYLLVNFLDRGDVSPEQRRNEALRILTEQFQVAIILQVPCFDTNDCKEFKRMQGVVERCLETIWVRGIFLIPELSNDGKELFIHVGHS